MNLTREISAVTEISIIKAIGTKYLRRKTVRINNNIQRIDDNGIGSPTTKLHQKQLAEYIEEWNSCFQTSEYTE